jgi:hypothetical protein
VGCASLLRAGRRAPQYLNSGPQYPEQSTATPEVLTTQVNCDSDLTSECGQAPVYVQVFSVTGQSIGCSRTVSKLDRLPGWPTVAIAQDELPSC